MSDPEDIIPQAEHDSVRSHWVNEARSRFALIPQTCTKDVHRLVDKELEAMVHAIATMQSLRHTASPVSKLPPEVLARIFVCCAVLERPRVEITATRRFHPGWITVTYVCRYWREAALQEPTLWWDISDEFGLHWMNELLARSKAVPVSLTQATDEVGDTSAVSQHIHHIRHLSVILFRDTRFSSVSRGVICALAKPAPMLESLRVSSRMSGYNPFMLPDDLFSHTTRLRRLQLEQCQLPLCQPVSPVLLNLTHLEITADTTKLIWGPSSSMDRELVVHSHRRFFSVLKQMVKLKILDLRLCLPHHRLLRRVFSDDYILSYPDLTCLRIKDRSVESHIFLRLLTVPSLSSLELECSNGPIGFDPSRQLMVDGALIHFTPSYLSAPFQTLSIQIWPLWSRYFKVAAWRSPSFPLPEGLPPDFSLLFHRPDSDQPFNFNLSLDLADDVCNRLFFTEVRTVYLEFDAETERDLTVQSLCNVFRKYGHVECVHVIGAVGLPLLDALVRPLDGDLLHKDNVLFPSLNTLAFDSVDFENRKIGTRNTDQDDTVYYTLLESCFRIRDRLGGHPRPKLAFTKCRASYNFEKQVTAIADVDWTYQF
ncbi:hypothetical protein EVG20_g3016 [Dentipellis fragilis]|uniref:Uncharacterized protein n=1 Tax=Dentipellis fragilis TaxID=205917 RepID=A0A4Y9Z6H3_9AGAM|nr:hypothetical protein EVG20_g3016 [Dentipellis fragilis]